MKLRWSVDPTLSIVFFRAPMSFSGASQASKIGAMAVWS
jgi:hypothetical protein